MLGITDQAFRSSYQKYYGGLDGGIAPFIRITDGGGFKDAKIRELAPEKNRGFTVIPQLMCNSSASFLSAWRILHHQYGYTAVNWNLGCPAPTTAGRGMGCGLMPQAELIDRILDEIYREISEPIAIKTRLGYQNSDDIFSLLQVFNRYPLHSITVHPRTGQQGYTGLPDMDSFARICESTHHKIFYSGDIRDLNSYHTVRNRFPKLSGILIGRGLLADPNLPEKIAGTKPNDSRIPQVVYLEFLRHLGREYLDRDLGIKQTLMRLKTLWLHYADSKSLDSRSIKSVRKTSDLDSFLREAAEAIAGLRE